MDIVDKIILYENGQLDFNETVMFFQEIIDSGLVEHLQGHYQRTAHDLIKAKHCVPADSRKRIRK